MPCSTKNRPVLRLLLFLVCATAGQPQAALPAREKLEYSVEWRLITAGKVQLGWSANPQADKAGWQTKVHLESTGLVSKLFKVNDDYSSLMTEDLCASSSLMVSEEGRRRRETRVTFDARRAKGQLSRERPEHQRDGGVERHRHSTLRARRFRRPVSTAHHAPGAGPVGPGADQRRQEERVGEGGGAGARNREDSQRHVQNHPLRSLSCSTTCSTGGRRIFTSGSPTMRASCRCRSA